MTIIGNNQHFSHMPYFFQIQTSKLSYYIPHKYQTIHNRRNLLTLIRVPYCSLEKLYLLQNSKDFAKLYLCLTKFSFSNYPKLSPSPPRRKTVYLYFLIHNSIFSK